MMKEHAIKVLCGNTANGLTQLERAHYSKAWRNSFYKGKNTQEPGKVPSRMFHKYSSTIRKLYNVYNTTYQ